MKKYTFIKFYITDEEECEGTLFVANTKDNIVVWFDNLNREWQGSYFRYEDLKNDKNFREVEKFDNGYINTEDILDPRALKSIITRFSMWFEEKGEEENEI